MDRASAVAVRFFALGFLLSLLAAGLAFFAPERLFVGSGPAENGIRLVHDRYEIDVFRDRSRWIADGGLAYMPEYPQEYPPLGALFIAAPRFFTDDKEVFEILSLARSAVCFGLLMAITAVLLDRFGRSRRRLLVFFLPAFLYFSLWRFDTFPAILASLMVLAVAADRYSGAVIAMFAGIAAKVYPVLFAVPLVLSLEKHPDPRKVRAAFVRGLLIAALLTMAFFLAAWLAGLSPLAMVFNTHAKRGIELGSIRELVIRALVSVGVSPAIGPLVAFVFGLLQFGAALPLIVKAKIVGHESFVRACLVLLIPFITFGWFFSQQWIIWLAPLAILVAGRREMVLLIALDLLLFLQFPVLYDADLGGRAFDVVTGVRTALLIAIWILNVQALPRFERPSRPVPVGAGA